MNDKPTPQHQNEQKEKCSKRKMASAEKAPAPTTLAGYYGDPKVKANRFVDALNKARIHNFADEDMTQVLSRLNTLDPSLERTTAILIAARKGDVQPMLGLLLDWVRRIIEHLAHQTGAVTALYDDVANVQSETLLRTFVQALRTRIESRSTDRPNAIAVLRLVLSYVGARGTGDPTSIARAVCRGLDGGNPQRPAASQVLRERAFGLLVTADLRVLDQAIALADLSEVMLLEATESAARSRSDASDQRRRVQQLSSALETARHEIAALEARLAASEASAKQAAKDAQDHKLIRTNTDQQTRGRMTSFVRNTLLPSIEQALEASELKPPRPEILQNLLHRLQEDLRKQMTWLTAPLE